MENRRSAMGMPAAVGGGIAFLIVAVVVAKIFDSPLSVIILVAMVLLTYAVVRHNSR
jgi:hypothetical protein